VVSDIPDGLWLEKRRSREKGRLGISKEKGRLKVAGRKIGVTPFQAMLVQEGLS